MSNDGFTIGGTNPLDTEVTIRMQNRGTSTDLARADIWLRDALLEISGNPDYRDEFDDLEVIGPTFSLTGGSLGTSVQEYPFSDFITSGDYNLATLDVFLWTDYPTNTIRKQLIQTNYQDADTYQQQPSIPAYWYRFGDSLGFTSPPLKNYLTQIRLYRRHPINATLAQTTILLPLEWNEILVWSAVLRGFMELLQFEKAQEIRTLLYGDPKRPQMQGLISSVKKRRGKENWRRQQSLRPRMNTYCS